MSNQKGKPFNLHRWFSLLSLLCIGLMAAMSAFLLSSFLSSNMLKRDAIVTMEFVQAIAQARNTSVYFESREQGESGAAFEDFFKRIVVMPEVERVNVYAMDGIILWSDQPGFIGQNFKRNPDLEKALLGRLAVNTGTSGKPKKAEHVFDKDVPFFMEMYIPVWNDGRDRVVGAVEVYKVPLSLFHTIRRGQQLIWMSAVGGGLILYGSLFWIVRRGASVIHRQQERLVESESMAAVGEIASVVAYGIRNPLSLIRSSAKVAFEEKSPPVFRRAAEDIIAETDRLEKWVRELLAFSRSSSHTLKPIQVNEVIRRILQGLQKELEKQRIKLFVEMEEPLPLLQADEALLSQMFSSLMVNAVEAMPSGGALTIASRLTDGQIQVKIFDTGQGVAQDQIGKVFKPFFTTKQNRLGMGLSWARLIVERHGGTIDLSSQEGHGMVVRLQIPVSGKATQMR